MTGGLLIRTAGIPPEALRKKKLVFLHPDLQLESAGPMGQNPGITGYFEDVVIGEQPIIRPEDEMWESAQIPCLCG